MTDSRTRRPRGCCGATTRSRCAHDWRDEDAIAILKAIRAAAPAQARLLLIEQIAPDDPGPHWSKMLDIHMLAFFAAKQRSRPEYEALLGRAGFSLEREIDTGADISILEATLV